MLRKSALAALCSLLSLCSASAALAANPLGIAWRNTTNVGLFAKPTGMLVAGRCNYKDAAFAQARAKGAEVLAYLNPVSRPDQWICALDTKFYMGDAGRVPLWPYPSYGQRTTWPNMRMADMRPGSAWILHVVKHVEGMMREGKVDGIYLDTVGVRVWQKIAEYDSWPTWEKHRWADGNVDLVRRLDASRRRINPKFLIIANNIWVGADGHGLAGERYVDGIALEHPGVRSAWHIKYAGRPFANLGHRRVLIIANNREEARIWANVPGVTHVSDQTAAQYKHPNTPPVGFKALNDR